jgi:hypothetical protein
MPRTLVARVVAFFESPAPNLLGRWCHRHSIGEKCEWERKVDLSNVDNCARGRHAVADVDAHDDRVPLLSVTLFPRSDNTPRG